MTSRRSPDGLPLRFALLLVPVSLSGAAALTYQVLWMRQLALVFGVTAYAASTVLAAFMAGLALGSLLAGRLATRVGRPLAAFAAAELLIALAVLAWPWLVDLLRPAFASMQASAADSRALLTSIRFLGSFAVLIVPTSMMGATLPLLAASAPARAGRAAARLSVLYAANTAGAIAGAWANGTLLVGSKQPIVLRRAAFEALRRDPVLGASLDGIGLTSFEALLSAYVAGPDEIRAFIGPGPVLTDDHPRLEYHGSLPAERGDIDLSALRGNRRRLRIVD